MTMKRENPDTARSERRSGGFGPEQKRLYANSNRITAWRSGSSDQEDFGSGFARKDRDADGWSITSPRPEELSAISNDALLLEDFVTAQKVRYDLPREYAYRQAREFLMQHLLDGELDPEDLLITTLYICEQDHEPQRANIAYSMTLTDALMCNWQQNGNGKFNDHLAYPRAYRDGGYPVQVSPTPLQPWECFAYEGIYRKTTPQRFDRSTQFELDPKVFKQFVWDADLQAHYQASLTQFWHDHGTDYNLLIKAALIKSAYVQHAEGSLDAVDKALVLRSIGLEPDQAWETLTFRAFADAPLPHTITFRELIVYRYVATDIMVIRDEQTDRLVAYIPGNSSPLHAFKGLPELRDWIALQCKDARKHKALEGHFKVEDKADGFFHSGVQTAFAGLAVYPHFLNQATGYWNPATEIHLGDAISPWPFSHFKHNLQSRLESDGQQLIRSRADYNKEVAALALSNAIMATGAIAMVAPLMWIPLAAMSLALIGLGADEVVEGRTLEEKKNGVGRIVFGVLNAVPALIEGGAAASRLLGAAARAGDELIPGAADEVGPVTARRSPEQKSAALLNHQQAQSQAADEAVEQAGESASERQARLKLEEQQRLAMKAHRQTTYDSAIAFGVEPEGLRTLPVSLRTALARLEYTEPLDLTGAWTTDSFGAVFKVRDSEAGSFSYFARVHSKIYRVERVEAVCQYRIFSPDEVSLKGPYIKKVKGFYSDIDLKPGLRGGDSYMEVLPAPEPAPEVVTSDIKLTRAQPPVNIEIPMDGIDTRAISDRFGNLTQRYFANNMPGGTKVFYNAEIACWESGPDKLLWLDNKGVWKTGTEKSYLAVRDKLRSSVLNDFYKFRRLPGFPAEPVAIEKAIHQVWLGRRLPGGALLENIKSNMRMSPELKFTLHIDIDDAATLDGMGPQQQLQQAFVDYPNMTISKLEDEPFFHGFTSDQHTAEPYSYFRRGEFENFAAASDVLRYRLIREYGGIYMDCDDIIGRPFEGIELNAGPSDVMVGTTLESPNLSFKGPGNSHFASRPGNPVFREMEREIDARFAKQRAVLEELAPLKAASQEGLRRYMTQISEITGPGLFLDVLRETRPDYVDLLDEQFTIDTNIYSSVYFERFNQAKDFYRPFASKLRIAAGSENSWKPPAA
jgi:hypothetical protein